MDRDSSGKVSFYELLMAIVDPSFFLQKNYVIKAFKAFDLNGSGSVSANEMQDFMSGIQPSVGRIINLNDADYKQVSPGKWCLSEQSGQFS